MSDVEIARLAREGDFASLAFRHEAPGPLGADEVEIEVDAVALNFKDVLLGLGLFPSADAATARGFGFECAGTVRRVGSDVTALAVGDDVVAIGSTCLATSVHIAADCVVRRPRSLSAAAAATLPIAFVTAEYALDDLARIRDGERVLIHAATGGVGLAALAVARAARAEIFATAGSDEKRAYLRELGVAHVMHSRTLAFVDEVLAATDGRGVDVVLNSLSGEAMQRGFDVLAPHGRFVELGARDAMAGATLALDRFARGGSYAAIGYEAALPGLGVRLARMIKRVERGELSPLPIQLFERERAAEAFAMLAGARHIGKVVIAMTPRANAVVESRAGRDPNLIQPDEGVRLFELALAGGHANVAISKRPLAARIHAQKRSPVVQSTASPARATVRPAHARPALAVAFTPPRDSREEKIAAVWAAHFGIDAVGIDDDFFDLGGDSLLAVQVAYAVREAIGIDFPTHAILEHPTVARLAARLSDLSPGTRETFTHLVRLAEGPPDARPIFLVHPIGGHVYFYAPLAERLATLAPVYGLQARGVDGEAPPLETIEAMAAAYVEAIRSVAPEGPYRLAGASFGGTVCFEMAHQLVAAGERVELLALMDSPTPFSLGANLRSDAEILAYLVSHGEDPTELKTRFSLLSEDAMLDAFVALGGKETNLSPSSTRESVRHLVRLFRANYDALLRYRLRRLGGRAVFFHAAEGFQASGYRRAWQEYFDQLDLVGVGGNHTTMNLPPHCERIVDFIATALEPTFQSAPLVRSTDVNSNLEIIKHCVQSYMTGDFEPIMNAIADDVCLRLTVGEGTPLSGVFRGKDGFSEYFARNAEVVETNAVEVTNFLVGGDQVAVAGRETITVKRSGRKMENADWMMVCTFRGEKIAEIVVIEDTSEISNAYR